MTNYEKIKQMSVEEMAEWLVYDRGEDCYACPVYGECKTVDGETCFTKLYKWLEREVE